MDKGNINGRMVECILVNICMIKNTVLEHMCGQMEENISDNGLIAKGTEKVKLYLLMVPKDKEYGKKIKELDGLNSLILSLNQQKDKLDFFI